MPYSEVNEPKECPIAHTLIIASIRFPEQPNPFDLVSILQLYKSVHNSLEGMREISCPLTRKPFQICPETMNSANVEIEPLYGETSDDYTQLPPDYEIMSAVLRICGHEAFERYMSSTDKDTLSIEDDSGNTPAHYAAEHGQTEILSALFKRDQKLLNKTNYQKLTPVLRVIAFGQEKILKVLLDKMPKLFDLTDEMGRTPAHHTAALGYAYRLAILTENSFYNTFYASDSYGCTTAHYAAAFGRVGALQELEKNWLRLLCKTDNKGRTPAHYAAAFGRVGALKELYKIKPYFFLQKDFKGRIPMHYAAANGHGKVVNYIIETTCGDGVYETDNQGNLAPHLAAAAGHQHLILGFAHDIRNDNPLNIPNRAGITPADIARFRGMPYFLQATSYQTCLRDWYSKWSTSTKNTVEASVIILVLFGVVSGSVTAELLLPLMPCAKALVFLAYVGVAATECLGLMFCSASVFTILLTLYVARQDYARQGIPQKNMWLYVSIALGSAVGLIGAIIVASKFMSLTPCIVQLVYFAIASAGILIGGLTSALAFLGIQAIADKRKQQALAELVEETRNDNLYFRDLKSTFPHVR